MKRFSTFSSISNTSASNTAENRWSKSLDSIDANINVLLSQAKEAHQDPKIAIQFLEECMDKILVKDDSSISPLIKVIKQSPLPGVQYNCDVKHVKLVLFMYGYLMLADPIVDTILVHLKVMAPDHPNTFMLLALVQFNKNDYLEALDNFSNMMSADSNEPVMITRDIYTKINICARIKDEIDHEYSIVQLQSGIDIANNKAWYKPLSTLINTYAYQLCNLVYILVDLESKKCLIVDPCWDVDGILNKIKINNWDIEGIILTHHHFDHCGGIPPPPFDKFYVKVPGVETILELYPNLPLYLHELEVDLFVNQPGNSALQHAIKPVQDLTLLEIGNHLKIQFIHTPGHTSGSMCLYINDCRLITGDTLFVSSCGRTDFPESNVMAMCMSLKRLSEFPEEVVVLPGHRYGGRQTTIRREKSEGLLRYAESEAMLFSILAKSAATQQQ